MMGNCRELLEIVGNGGEWLGMVVMGGNVWECWGMGESSGNWVEIMVNGGDFHFHKIMKM